MEGVKKEPRNLFAVTGNPVLHSKSPDMFNALFQQLPQRFGPNFVYTRLAASDPVEAIYMFRQLGLRGMNVTAPFKKDMMLHLDMAENAAIRVGGVNTVFNRDYGMIGTNTDFSGVVESLKRRNIQMEKRQFVILGAGGAGRAAAYGLVREGAEVIIVNRSYSKTVEAAYMTGGRAEDFSTLGSLLRNAHGLISTLSADIDVVDEHWLNKDLVVFDANYKRSALSVKARARGCTVITGEEWLLNQGIPALRHFLGYEADAGAQQIMAEALKPGKQSKQKSIVALVGFMGSGKSYIGKMLAKQLGYQFKDTDQLIEAKAGCSIPQIFKEKGEPWFRNIEKEILNEELQTGNETVYACGGGIVLDEKNKTILKNRALTIWLYSSIEKTLLRLVPGERPLLDLPDPGQEAKKLLEQRLIHYARSSHLVVCSEPEAQEVAKKIHAEINQTFNN